MKPKSEAQLKHIERLKELYPKGAQVQKNMGPHHIIRIERHPDGFYYTPIDPHPHLLPYKGTPTPIGRQLQFPKEWGRKRAATHLLQSRISDIQTSIKGLNEELEGLTKLLSEVPQWPDEIDVLKGGYP